MNEFLYDVAVSFAGEDRPTVEQLVKLLQAQKIRVFYDMRERSSLWGKDLYQYLDRIYRTSSRYCVIFISANYARKAWTSHELRSAQARAFQQNAEYILPLRLDDTEVPGIQCTIGYLDLRHTSIADVAALIIEKLRPHLTQPDLGQELASGDPERRARALYRVGFERESRFRDRAVQLLSDPDVEVREAAALALDNLNDPVVIPALIEALHDSSWSVRSSAGWALVHLGEVVREEAERVAQHSRNEDARQMAKLVLAKL